MFHESRRAARRAPAAFTLLELLVVIAIISVLTALLLPALRAVRAQAGAVECAANMRQVAFGLLMYAQDNKGQFPPNTAGAQPRAWFDPDRIGRYLSVSRPEGSVLLRSRVLTCPEDPDAARASAMNFWASSEIDKALKKHEPGRGRRWKADVGNSSKMILLGERYATIFYPGIGWAAASTFGVPSALPGQRFGAGGGLIPPAPGGKRYGPLTCEIAFWRHRFARSTAKLTAPVGRANFAYADGRVELKAAGELANFSTGLSTLDSLWSPGDYAINR